jgi:hypothetical protein
MFDTKVAESDRSLAGKANTVVDGIKKVIGVDVIRGGAPSPIYMLALGGITALMTVVNATV